MHLLAGFALSVAASCLTASHGAAQQAGPDGKPSPDVIIRKMDRNKDGRLSADEFRAARQRFDFMDADKDGYLTREEIAAAFTRKQQGGGSRGASGQGGGNPNADWYAALPIILTHTHIFPRVGHGRTAGNDWAGAERNMLATLDRNGIRGAVVMPTPRGPSAGPADDAFFDSLHRVVKRHPDRLRIAGGGWTLNVMTNSIDAKNVSAGDRRKFADRAEDLIAKGAIGFGETTALHFSMFNGHPFEEVQPDHPFYLLLADLAAKHDVPLDIHMEAVTEKTWAVPEDMRDVSSPNPRLVHENITAFERLLAHNPKARIVWVHLGMDTTGQRSPDLTRRLLATYPNLYVSITQSQQRSEVYPLLAPGSGLDRRWRDVIMAFPDRFMIGSDAFFIPDAGTLHIGQNLSAALLIVRRPFLPPAVARKLAFENAQRIFKLNLIDPASVPLPEENAPVRAAAAQTRETGYLSEADIRRAVVGNTITFRAPANGREIFAYFAEDGTVALRIMGGPHQVVEKSWFFKDGGTLCRTVGPQNREHCARIKAGPAADIFDFVVPQNHYQVTVLHGRQLPD